MKKTIRMITAMVMVIFLLTATTVPALADSDPFGLTDTQKELLDDFREEAAKQQDAFQDTFSNIQKQHKEAEKQHEETLKKAKEKVDVMAILAVTLIVLAVSLVVAEIVYIYIAAPKCGMSRFWALVPLFSNLIGLIVFIVVRSSRKATAPGYTIVCPTCNSVHPKGTTRCNICGTDLT